MFEHRLGVTTSKQAFESVQQFKDQYNFGIVSFERQYCLTS